MSDKIIFLTPYFFLRKSRRAMSFSDIAHGAGCSEQDVAQALYRLKDLGLVRLRYDFEAEEMTACTFGFIYKKNRPGWAARP